MNNLLVAAVVLLATLTLVGCASREFEKSPCHDALVPVFGSDITTDYKDLHYFDVSFRLETQPGEDTDIVFYLGNRWLDKIEATLLKHSNRTSPHVVVTTDAPDCEYVWALHTEILHSIVHHFAEDTTIGFAERWHHYDYKGKPVPPGEYLVHGVLRMRHPTNIDLVAFKRLVMESPNEGS